MRPRQRSGALLAALLVAILGGLALHLVGWTPWPSAPAPAAPPARLSLLAVGDTGEPGGWLPGFSDQDRVGRAMAEVDREAPVDAVVLLGDNFYPDGLRDADIEERLRENVEEPYCRFVALTALGRARLGGCASRDRDHHPVPLLAVLGNHDYKLRQSPDLQRHRVPAYLADWSVPEGLAAVTELGAGVSLVRVDSMQLVEGADPAPVTEALRRARGPWRILAAHHPMVDPGRGLDPHIGPAMRRAVAEAHVPVQLYLSGHEHNLQVLTAPPPAPPLQVVAGGGSNTRHVHPTPAERLFGLESLGFARVDLVPGQDGEALCVTLHAVESPPPFALSHPVSRWCVDARGRVRPG